MERREMVINEHSLQPIISQMTLSLERKIQRMTRIESLEENLLKKDEVKNKIKKFLNKNKHKNKKRNFKKSKHTPRQKTFDLN